MQKIYFIMCVILACFTMQAEGCHSINWESILQEFNVALQDDIDIEVGQVGQNLSLTNNDRDNLLRSSRGNNRLYIKPEFIVVQNKRLFLSLDHGYMPIDNIQCDSFGYFTTCTEGWISWKCCKCQTLNSYEWNGCSGCGKQKC